MVGGPSTLRRLITFYLPLTLFAVLLLFPFYWMLVVSLRPNADLFDTKVNPFWPWNATLDNYRYLLNSTGFPSWTVNTVIVTFASTFCR